MIPLFIPYVNRFDLLEKAVRAAQCPLVEVNIINNSDGPSIGIPGTEFIQRRPPVPLSFAQTQNWMLSIAEGDSDYEGFYLFCHADAEAGEGTVQKLVEMAQRLTSEGTKWSACFTAYDALAAFNTEAFRAVGGWDTFLEHYLSDCDMYLRLRLAGYPTFESNLPVKHTPSQTLQSDPEYKRKVDFMFPCRQAYYRAKWNGDNEHEQFDVPWGGK